MGGVSRPTPGGVSPDPHRGEGGLQADVWGKLMCELIHGHIDAWPAFICGDLLLSDIGAQVSRTLLTKTQLMCGLIDTLDLINAY